MITTTQIARARQVDLVRLIEPDTTLIHIANTHGGEYAGPCPFCGGTDRFHVVPATGRWYCRQCTPRGGDAIDYVRQREQLSFQDAVQILVGGTAWAPRAPRCVQMRARPNTPPIALPNPEGGRPAGPCSPGPRGEAGAGWTQPAWQQAAQGLMEEAERCLADDTDGADARAYLNCRGLRPETWQAWRLGSHHAWQPVRREARLAITLPWIGTDGMIQAVQYRFFGSGIARHDRFGQKAGGQRSLFGLHRLSGRATLIVTEGELNAISCWQVAGRWADVLSIGSQENARQARVSEALQSVASPYRRVIAWLDERELALTVADRIVPFNGTAVWSENGLDANDLLQRGLLAARLVNAGLAQS